VIERGEFVTWAEKIRRKPIVQELFGGLMAFIGYNKTPEVDYLAAARALYERDSSAFFTIPSACATTPGISKWAVMIRSGFPIRKSRQ
jgi:hypothetical protein